MGKYQELSPNALGITGALFGFVAVFLGVLFYGLGGIMKYQMPYGYVYAAWAGVFVAIGCYVLGVVLACLYNRALRIK